MIIHYIKIRQGYYDTDSDMWRRIQNAPMHKRTNLTVWNTAENRCLHWNISICKRFGNCYFKSYKLPDGIELGQVIRQSDEQAVIICLTSSKDFAYQAFGIYAQRYLLKPLDTERLYEAMDFAISDLCQKIRLLSINTAEGIQKISYQEIEYIENSARTLHVFKRTPWT